MLNATTENGTLLAYPNFLDTVNAIRFLMLMRAVGGGLYLAGWLLMAYNAWRTVRGAERVNGTIEVFEDEPAPARLTLTGAVLNPPVIFAMLGFGFVCAWMFGHSLISIAGLAGAILCVVLAYAHFETRWRKWGDWYERLLVNSLPFTILTFVAVVAGGLIQIIPTIVVHQAANVEDRRQIPYTPLVAPPLPKNRIESRRRCHSGGPAAPGGGAGAWIPALVVLIVAPAVGWALTQFVLLPALQKKLLGPPVAAAGGSAETAAASAAPEAKSGPEAPPTYEFTNVVVNLAGTMGTRYLDRPFSSRAPTRTCTPCSTPTRRA